MALTVSLLSGSRGFIPTGDTVHIEQIPTHAVGSLVDQCVRTP